MKYLKAIVLASDPALASTLRRSRHDLSPLARRAASLHPELSDRTFLLFCKHISPYQQWGHYPESIFNQTYMASRWNTGYCDGIKEMDLVIATLRAVAIRAGGSRPDSAYVLECIVHRDYWMDSETEPTRAAQLCMREALLQENQFFTPAHLPTYAQRYQERRVFPMLPLPSRHPDFYKRMGVPDPDN